MKFTLTQKHFELGGHRCRDCPVNHALQDADCNDILVYWEGASFIYKFERVLYESTAELFEIIRKWDTYQEIPSNLPLEIEVELKPYQGYWEK